MAPVANLRGNQPSRQGCELLQEGRGHGPGTNNAPSPRPSASSARWLSFCRAAVLRAKNVGQCARFCDPTVRRGPSQDLCVHGAPRPLVSFWGHHLPSQLNPQAATSWGPPRDDASTPGGPTTACPLSSAPPSLLHNGPGASCVSRLLRTMPVKVRGKL